MLRIKKKKTVCKPTSCVYCIFYILVNYELKLEMSKTWTMGFLSNGFSQSNNLHDDIWPLRESLKPTITLFWFLTICTLYVNAIFSVNRTIQSNMKYFDNLPATFSFWSLNYRHFYCMRNIKRKNTGSFILNDVRHNIYMSI